MLAYGKFGDVSLSGLTFGVAVNWPKAIHNGNGEGVVVIDERANAAQREALRIFREAVAT